MPIISATASWLILVITGSGFPSLPKFANSKSSRASRFLVRIEQLIDPARQHLPRSRSIVGQLGGELDYAGRPEGLPTESVGEAMRRHIERELARARRGAGRSCGGDKGDGRPAVVGRTPRGATLDWAVDVAPNPKGFFCRTCFCGRYNVGKCWELRRYRGELAHQARASRQGRALHTSARAVRGYCCPSDPWRASRSIRTNLAFGSSRNRAKEFCARCRLTVQRPQ